MRKLHLIAFQFFLFLCALLSNSVVLTYSLTENLYWDLLKIFKINVEFLKILRDNNIRSYIQSYIISEHLKHQLNNKVYNKYDLIDHIERNILKDYPNLIYRSNVNRTELHRFLDRFIVDEERIIRDFMNHFFYNTFDIKEVHNGLWKRYYEEQADITHLKTTFFSISKEISETSNIYNEENTLYYNDNREKNVSRLNSLKNIVTQLQNKVNVLYGLGYEVVQLQRDIRRDLINYKNTKNGINDASILDQLENIIYMSIYNLENKVTSLRFQLKRKISFLLEEIDRLSNEVGIDKKQGKLSNFSYYKDTILTVEEIKSEYEEYMKGVEFTENSDVKNTYTFFEKLLLLLGKYTYWLENQNPYSYCQRKDIPEVLSISVKLVEKLRDSFIDANNRLVKLFENLYDELNKFLYTEKHNSTTNIYNLAWNDIENFHAKDLLTGCNRLSHIIFILQKLIRIYKDKNNHLDKNSLYNLDKMLISLQNMQSSLELHKSQFVKLVHSPENLQMIRNDLETNGNVFREKFLRIKTTVNSFEVASGQLNSEIDNILYLISNIINNDNLIEEFRKIRNLWRRYVKDNYKQYKHEDRLIKAYKENKNIIFPPDFGLTKSFIVNDSINKNVLASSYFTNLYNDIIKKFDSLKTQDEMLDLFSVVYRSVDSIIKLIKENRKMLKLKYDKKRKEILELINIKNYSRDSGQSTHTELIELEKNIVNNLQKLFMNKINLHKQIENSVELIKDDLYKNKLPSYCNLVEKFITKYFLTISKWKIFINRNKGVIPSNLIYKIENV
ncbi:conserved Plasmodium protein, unknown function [Plasmodium gallinaceum]|uniref:Uncharacterized protein n=1 Tax=Plasmodium gallinaceum TaxID=5849 RepID=A0A1J1GTE3_PLAGA|nr:conserved Plasmodium protein, unknown function [Plasmodium gallinaceum]CRG95569.1 conserved Plasmodium protein, unknown function [Plasmodium gallinaceum]